MFRGALNHMNQILSWQQLGKPDFDIFLGKLYTNCSQLPKNPIDNNWDTIVCCIKQNISSKNPTVGSKRDLGSGLSHVVFHTLDKWQEHDVNCDKNWKFIPISYLVTLFHLPSTKWTMNWSKFALFDIFHPLAFWLSHFCAKADFLLSTVLNGNFLEVEMFLTVTVTIVTILLQCIFWPKPVLL